MKISYTGTCPVRRAPGLRFGKHRDTHGEQAATTIHSTIRHHEPWFRTVGQTNEGARRRNKREIISSPQRALGVPFRRGQKFTRCSSRLTYAGLRTDHLVLSMVEKPTATIFTTCNDILGARQKKKWWPPRVRYSQSLNKEPRQSHVSSSGLLRFLSQESHASELSSLKDEVSRKLPWIAEKAVAEAGKHFRQKAEEDMKTLRADRDRRLQELQVSNGSVETYNRPSCPKCPINTRNAFSSLRLSRHALFVT